MPDDRCLIWSFEHSGWWGPGRVGYTQEIAKAGQYPLEEALRICRNANIAAINEAVVVLSGRRSLAPLQGTNGEPVSRQSNLDRFERTHANGGAEQDQPAAENAGGAEPEPEQQQAQPETAHDPETGELPLASEKPTRGGRGK